ncbi:MAG: hypothetical protein JRJ56_04395, partial [Deltaproteobacteria bacterium]|nr:hypothetical protein [Deltaproteobacteria bacterium]
MSNWRVAHQCPQCGAPVTLDEEVRLFVCPYCRVRLCLASRDCFHYYLPGRDGAGDENFYLPYWRLRGMYFSCRSDRVKARLLDSSIPAATLAGLPSSLGIRPQAVPLRFLDGEVGTACLPRQRSLGQAVRAVAASQPAGGRGLYAAFVGEVATLIYLPVACRRGEVVDGLDGRPLPGLSPEILRRQLEEKPPGPAWKLDFLPALCPACGWDLEGEPATLVFVCPNCARAWSATAAGLQPLAGHRLAVPLPAGARVLQVPFWRLRVAISGLELDTVADLVRLANLARVVTPELRRRELFFWLPAFKVQPRLFLRLAGLLTVSQPDDELEVLDGGQRFHPVTLPAAEALQSLRILLATLLKPRRRILPRLAGLRFAARETKLVYRPFVERGREVVDAAL